MGHCQCAGEAGGQLTREESRTAKEEAPRRSWKVTLRRNMAQEVGRRGDLGDPAAFEGLGKPSCFPELGALAEPGDEGLELPTAVTELYIALGVTPRIGSLFPLKNKQLIFHPFLKGRRVQGTGHGVGLRDHLL